VALIDGGALLRRALGRESTLFWLVKSSSVQSANSTEPSFAHAVASSVRWTLELRQIES